MSASDFDNSSLLESGEEARSRKNRRKRKGCFVNMWKMAHNTKIVPQKKLYNYLADQSTVLGDSDVNVSQVRSPKVSR